MNFQTKYFNHIPSFLFSAFANYKAKGETVAAPIGTMRALPPPPIYLSSTSLGQRMGVDLQFRVTAKSQYLAHQSTANEALNRNKE